MICSCGGTTRTKYIRKQRKIIGEYEECFSCGRVEWIMKPKPNVSAMQMIEILKEKWKLNESTR